MIIDGQNKYIHKLEEEYFTFIKELWNIEFESEWMVIRNGNVFIKEGYSWDGCSPKWEWVDFVFGTPEGRICVYTGKPITYEASLIHDALYQFKGSHGISRRTSDLIFKKMLKRKSFKWSGLYYFVVRVVGSIYGKW